MPENLQQHLVGEGYGSGADDDLDAQDQAKYMDAGEVSSGSAEIDPGLVPAAVTATQENQVEDVPQPPQGYEQLGGSGEEAEQDE